MPNYPALTSNRTKTSVLSITIALILLVFNTKSAFAGSQPERVEITSLQARTWQNITDLGVCDACGVAYRHLFLSAAIKNNSLEPQPYATVMEIRDHNGITQYLQFGLGKLGPNATLQVTLSWDPTEPGEYELRSFVVSDVARPEALSIVHSTTVRVS